MLAVESGSAYIKHQFRNLFSSECNSSTATQAVVAYEALMKSMTRFLYTGGVIDDPDATWLKQLIMNSVPRPVPSPAPPAGTRLKDSIPPGAQPAKPNPVSPLPLQPGALPLPVASFDQPDLADIAARRRTKGSVLTPSAHASPEKQDSKRRKSGVCDGDEEMEDASPDVDAPPPRRRASIVATNKNAILGGKLAETTPPEAQAKAVTAKPSKAPADAATVPAGAVTAKSAPSSRRAASKGPSPLSVCAPSPALKTPSPKDLAKMTGVLDFTAFATATKKGQDELTREVKAIAKLVELKGGNSPSTVSTTSSASLSPVELADILSKHVDETKSSCVMAAERVATQALADMSSTKIKELEQAVEKLTIKLTATSAQLLSATAEAQGYKMKAEAMGDMLAQTKESASLYRGMAEAQIAKIHEVYQGWTTH